MNLFPRLAVAALAALAAPVFAQNLVVNGSFEAGTFLPNGTASQSIAIGSTAITGWTIGSTNTLWIANGNPWSLTAADGARFLDLTDNRSTNPFSAVSQVLATNPGDAYRLTFSVGSSGAYGTPISVQATAGSTSQVFQVTSLAANLWTTMTLDFVATASTTVLTLQGFATSSNYIGLDNVSVVSQVPEAPTVLMFSLGLAGVLLARRRSGPMGLPA